MSAAATSITSGTALRPGSARRAERRERRAEAPHGTRRAVGTPRRAPRRAEIHERLVEVVSAPSRQRGWRQPPRPPLAANPLGPAGPEDPTAEPPAYVRIEPGRTPTERERQHRAGGIPPDTGQRAECVAIVGEATAVARHGFTRD